MPHPTRRWAWAIAIAALFASGCERALFAVVNRNAAPPATSVVFDAAHDLSLDVYRPAVSATAAPVVVFFYGGEWKRGARADYRFVGQRLAQAGVVAIVADYRTYPRTTFPGFIEDGAHAVAWARANATRFGGDPARLFVAGHSAGAQIAALLGTDARYLQHVGMQPRDLAGVIGLSGPYDFNIGPNLQPVFGTRGADAQPIAFVDGDEPPFLLVHGRKDRTVEAVDSELLAARLRAHGDAVQLTMLPDGTHTTPLAAFYDPRRAPQVMPALLAFIAHPRAHG
ncbi:carboxylesterase [Lysobacter helvus]|uniref:Carboxylesterase n=2 Tax=Lysobacteraceae TaxID=32033 RepID=A0ABN6FQF6_9GAMM|nr:MULTISPECIES: alpha/beta hydrolase [Lysobacter]BCT91644.1 carboxylesterase [Lysobacter caseinilyticus]BCT94797.1 carboxylesterase [Lysobacter helvus]